MTMRMDQEPDVFVLQRDGSTKRWALFVPNGETLIQAPENKFQLRLVGEGTDLDMAVRRIRILLAEREEG